MSRVTILLADNDSDFREVVKELLESEGYGVISVSSANDARRILEEQNIDVAILDIRMHDDQDDRDETGISLARDMNFINVPKIILTNFPTVDYVKRSLGPSRSGIPAAIDFLGKREGAEMLLAAVKKAVRSQKVLIVHGYNKELASLVSSFLKRIGLQPIILDENPNTGRTIREMLKDRLHGIAFAVVLLTPAEPIKSSKEKMQRENLIDEVHYLSEALGSDRVIILREGEVRLPSELSAKPIIPIDENRKWQLSLYREFQRAHLHIKLIELI